MKKICSAFLLIFFMISSLTFAAYPEEYPIYLRMLGFTKDEVNYMHKGRMVTHSIENKAPGEFGIIAAQVYNVPVYFYRDFFRSAENFGSILNFEQIGKFKSKPDLQDLKALSMSKGDIDEFLKCRTGTCDLMLTPEEIQLIPENPDLSTSGEIEKVTDVYRQILLNRVMKYREKGIRAFDQASESGYDLSSALVEEHLHRFTHVQAYFPLLEKSILEYPKYKNGEEFFYWTKEHLGSKPIVTLRHVFSQRVGEDYVQASILVYSSHSYLSSINITHLINYDDFQVPRTLVVSEQRTITDLHGNIVKALGRNKLRSNLEKRASTWIKVVGKTMEDRYLNNVEFRNFPYGLLARDQR
jgi:hypothetical protein